MNDVATNPTALESLTVIILAMQTLATFLAVIFAGFAYMQTRDISEKQRETTIRIHDEQVKLAKLQAFIPFSEQFDRIVDIDLDYPDWGDVSTSANLLELIAISWENEILDRDVLLTMYGHLFINVFEQIYMAKDNETEEYRGRMVLELECPKTIPFYNKLCNYFKVYNIINDYSNL